MLRSRSSRSDWWQIFGRRSTMTTYSSATWACTSCGWRPSFLPLARIRWVIANGFASMGIALPGALAAKLVHPERKVVAVSGDGGFLMNSQELETAKRCGTPFVTVVCTDSRYGVIELNQQRRFGRTFAVEFTNPDLVKYAEAFGLPGFRVERTEDLLPVLR